MFKYRLHAALASAALLFFSGCVQSQAPVIDSSRAVRDEVPQRAEPPARGVGGEMLLGQIQALQEELMYLRGVVEEQGHQLEMLKQQSLERYIELDRRIGVGAEGTGTQGTGTQGTGTQGGGAEGVASEPGAPLIPTPSADQPLSGPAGADQRSASSEGAVGAGGSNGARPGQQDDATTTVMPTEMDTYRDAYNLVKAQNFIGAVAAFEAFLQAYPESNLVPNAHYWLGELHLQSPQNLDKAEQAFGRVLENHSRHAKAPDALYKLGRIEFLRGNRDQARELLQQVIDEYGASGSAAPQLAKQFLDQNYR